MYLAQKRTNDRANVFENVVTLQIWQLHGGPMCRDAALVSATPTAPAATAAAATAPPSAAVPRPYAVGPVGGRPMLRAGRPGPVRRPREVFGGARRGATRVRGHRRAAAGPVLEQEDYRGDGIRVVVVAVAGAAVVQNGPQGPVRGRLGRVGRGPRGRVPGTAAGVRQTARPTEQRKEKKTHAAQKTLTKT